MHILVQILYSMSIISIKILLLLLFYGIAHSFIAKHHFRGFPLCRKSATIGSRRRRNSVQNTDIGLQESVIIKNFISLPNDKIVDEATLVPLQFNSSFLQAMQERGYIYQCTSFKELDYKLMNSNSLSAYIGFDATAKSLHVGSLVQLMVLRLLQHHGIKPIILIGGGTTRVGDPTGRNSTRQILSDNEIQQNIQGLSKVFSKYIKIGSGPTDGIIINSSEWWDKMNHIDFIRSYYKHFTVQQMLGLHKQRLMKEESLSLLEFSYIPLQAYDFVELNNRYGTCLQIGGSDQYSNIFTGVTLARKANQVNLFGLTTPLVTTFRGTKMGKTEGGAIWLDSELLAPFDYWQYWRNCADVDTIKFLKLFTDIPMEQIRKYENLTGSELNPIKIILADEATALLHGKDCLPAIHQQTAVLFKSKKSRKVNSS